MEIDQKPEALKETTEAKPAAVKESVLKPNNPTKPQATTAKDKSSKPKSSTSKSVLLLVLATIFGFVGGFAGSRIDGGSTSSPQSVQREIVSGEENLINTIAKDVSESVVSVNVTGVSYTEDFFGYSNEQESRSAGTGFIIDDDGLVLTNRHVVPSSTTEVEIVFADGSTAKAEVVGRTSDSDPLDIAFLRIENATDYELKPVALGDSDKLEVGDRVVAIGNALGEFQNTVTSGIISGFGRDIEAYDGESTEQLQNLLQTDAAINSGNSGGPLVNSASEVIGVNVATASAENISFAIPINDVKNLVDTVIETGKLERPFLGVRYVSLTEGVAKELGLSVSEGAYIPESGAGQSAVLSGSPASEAGVEAGDIIIAIDGEKITQERSLVSILGSKRVGQEVALSVIRGDQNLDLQAKLEATPEQ